MLGIDRRTLQRWARRTGYLLPQHVEALVPALRPVGQFWMFAKRLG
jgi:hypothetical protein